ncbi:hypothetical protein [Amphibiibacter pelophylacis]|uniref:Uncharacterized protein n=1 Tax=Amphibiibacter pelophylacis TaxID=1799477 RepID=A0ACC6P2F6_9BURK
MILDVAWHLAQWLWPVWFLAATLPLVARRLWPLALAHRTWGGLALACALAGMAVWAGGLAMLGYDGAMVSYLAVLAVMSGVLVLSMRTA